MATTTYGAPRDGASPAEDAGVALGDNRLVIAGHPGDDEPSAIVAAGLALTPLRRSTLMVLDLDRRAFVVAPGIAPDQGVISLTGDLDIASSPMFAGAIAVALHHRPSLMVLDVRRLTSIDARGTGDGDHRHGGGAAPRLGWIAPGARGPPVRGARAGDLRARAPDGTGGGAAPPCTALATAGRPGGGDVTTGREAAVHRLPVDQPMGASGGALPASRHLTSVVEAPEGDPPVLVFFDGLADARELAAWGAWRRDRG
jgi:hypothetical protein